MRIFKLNLLAATLAAVAMTAPIATFAAPPSDAASSTIATPGGFGAGNGGDGLDLEVAAAMKHRSSNAFSAPVPVPMPYEISFSDLKQRWDEGVGLSAQDLLGSWKVVAKAVPNACIYLFGDYKITGYYSASGIGPTDAAWTLKFGFINRTSNPFGGSHDERILAVDFLNFSEKGSHQGPYQVNSGEPQFSQWSYDKDGKILKSGYFEYHCRGVRGDSQRMVCATRLRVSELTAASPEAIECLQASISEIDGLEKIKASK